MLGCGFAGLEAAVQARLLLGKRAEITAVDRRAHQVYLPRLHEVLSGKLREEDLRLPLEPVFRVLGIRFRHGTVEAVDAENRRVRVDGAWLPYDFLILALGSEVDDAGVPGAGRHGTAFKSLEQVHRARERLLALETGPAEHPPVVIVGGGLEGVEVAGDLLDALGSAASGVVLVEARSRLLPDLPEAAGRLARRVLEARGATLCLGTRTVRVTEDRVCLSDGKRLPYGLLVWAGGVRPPEILRDSGLALDEGGWLAVDPCLRSRSHPEVLGAGDVIGIAPGQWQRRASHALDQGGLAALNVHAAISGYRPMRYVPRFRPVLFSLGETTGVMVIGENVRSGAELLGLKRRLLEVHWARYSVGLLARRLDASLPGYAARYFLWKALAW